MVLGLLRRKKKKKKKARKIKIGYLVIDLTEDGLWVGDKFIPRKNILGINPDTKTIIYTSEDGRIQEISYKK